VISLLRSLLRWVVDDVPLELDACEACREPECTEARAATCPRRLQTIVARNTEGKR
jgi:hypothetical protein